MGNIKKKGDRRLERRLKWYEDNVGYGGKLKSSNKNNGGEANRGVHHRPGSTKR